MYKYSYIVISDIFNCVGESLISWDHLKSMVEEKKQFVDSETDIIKNKIQILLVTANEIEYYAVLASLNPLEGYPCLFKYHHITPNGENSFYIFGRFGYFNAAVHQMPEQGPAAAQEVVTVAADCFGHHLNAIFAVGVACGVEGKAEMLDVLVSEKISVYTAARISTTSDGDYKIENRGQLPLSSFLQTYFDQPPKWPTSSSEIANKLRRKPTLRKGNILSGNYLIDNKMFKEQLLKEFAYNAIGIEMKDASLIHGTLNSTYQTMVVKAVCDFGDGNKDKTYQPTAAMLAVECLKHYISSPQLPQKLEDFCCIKGILFYTYMYVHAYIRTNMYTHGCVSFK